MLDGADEETFVAVGEAIFVASTAQGVPEKVTDPWAFLHLYISAWARGSRLHRDSDRKKLTQRTAFGMTKSFLSGAARCERIRVAIGKYSSLCARKEDRLIVPYSKRLFFPAQKQTSQAECRWLENQDDHAICSPRSRA